MHDVWQKGTSTAITNVNKVHALLKTEVKLILLKVVKI